MFEGQAFKAKGKTGAKVLREENIWGVQEAAVWLEFSEETGHTGRGGHRSAGQWRTWLLLRMGWGDFAGLRGGVT